MLNVVQQIYHQMRHENYPLYLWENCDTYLFIKTEGSYLIKTQAGMGKALKTMSRLPARLIVVLYNEPFKNETVFYFKAMERVIKWFCSMATSAIKSRKDQLPHKAIAFGLPKVILVKPVVLEDLKSQFILDPETGFRKESLKVKTQKYNSLIDKIAPSYGVDWIDLSLDEEDSSMYSNNNSMLSPDGAQMFWISLCDELKKLDESKYCKRVNSKPLKVFNKGINRKSEEDRWSTTAQVNFPTKHHRKHSKF